MLKKNAVAKICHSRRVVNLEGIRKNLKCANCLEVVNLLKRSDAVATPKEAFSEFFLTIHLTNDQQMLLHIKSRYSSKKLEVLFGRILINNGDRAKLSKHPTPTHKKKVLRGSHCCSSLDNHKWKK